MSAKLTVLVCFKNILMLGHYAVTVNYTMYQWNLTLGILVPQACATYNMRHIVNLTHSQDANCHGDKSASMTFTVTAADNDLVLDFPSQVDLREAYLFCNATDNRRVQLLYNGQISQTVSDQKLTNYCS